MRGGASGCVHRSRLPPRSPDHVVCAFLRYGLGSGGSPAVTVSRPYGLVPPSFCSVTSRTGKVTSRKVSPRSSGRCYRGSAGAAGDRGIGRANSASLGPPMSSRGRSWAPGRPWNWLPESPSGDEGRELLRRTKEELGQLSELIEPLLRLSTGTEMLRLQHADLVEITREAVASSSLGIASNRVTHRCAGSTDRTRRPSSSSGARSATSCGTRSRTRLRDRP